MCIVVLRDEENSCFALEQRHLVLSRVLSALCRVTRIMNSACRHTGRDCSAVMVMLVSVRGTLGYLLQQASVSQLQ